jgi:DNA-binding transcriptional LysR family regulator
LEPGGSVASSCRQRRGAVAESDEMHRRHTKKNIPIELLRALVTIVDTGSYTKAADTLDLTQSAISSQIARLGRLLGGSIFAKGQGNMTPTKRGLLVLQYARRMLSMNDELLTFAGPNSAPRQFVIGLPSWLGRERLVEIFERCSASEQVSFRCDRVERLLGDLNVGSIDVAYLCNTINSPRSVIAQWSEPTVWMKSPKLALRPGAPIPLISWPGTTGDRVAVELLEDRGMQFFVAFSAPEFSARLAAVAAGIGVLATQARCIIPGIEIVRDGLPALPANKAGIYARDGLNLDRHAPLLRTLTDLLVPRDSAERTPAVRAGEGLAGKELAGKELAPPPRVRTHELHRAR